MTAFAKTLFAYVFAFAIACGTAPLVAWPFLRGRDWPVYVQMMFIGMFTGIYALVFLPFVAMAHVAIRKAPFHRLLPIVSFLLFGVLLPLVGFLLDRYHWWPEEPLDMDARQILCFLAITLAAIGAGVAVVFTRSPKGRRRTNLAGAAAAPYTPRRATPKVSDGPSNRRPGDVP